MQTTARADQINDHIQPTSKDILSTASHLPFARILELELHHSATFTYLRLSTSTYLDLRYLHLYIYVYIRINILTCIYLSRSASHIYASIYITYPTSRPN